MSGSERGEEHIDGRGRGGRGVGGRDGGRQARGTASDWTPEDAAFAEQLRAGLHAAAAEVEPDPAGWRQLNARIRRRRTYGWGGGLALAGAAVALVAVLVLPGDGPRVDFAPVDSDGAVATQPATAPEGTPPPTTGAEGPAPAAAEPVAGGILYSDGNSIHVADLDGTVLSTPAALGVSSQTVTDVAVRPRGTTETFTMAYRVDGVSEGSEDGCGDISWVHVPGGDALDTSGALPRPAAAAEDCLGAPVFASDGSALGWLAETADGEVQLQAVDWTERGPVEGSFTTLDLALEQYGDLRLTAWTMYPATDSDDDLMAVGSVALRGSDGEGPGVFRMNVVRQVDGSVALVGDPAIAVRQTPEGVPGTIVDVPDDSWTLVPLTTAGGGSVLGAAYRAATQGGEDQIVTIETALPFDPDRPFFIDAIATSALVGSDGAQVLIEVDVEEGATSLATDLPSAVTGALLGAAPAPSADPDATVAPPPPSRRRRNRPRPPARHPPPHRPRPRPPRRPRRSTHPLRSQRPSAAPRPPSGRPPERGTGKRWRH